MVKFISELTRELKIEHHTLRNWEDKGLLGVVQKDFTHGRMYTEEQVERIKVIQGVVKEQREKGLKRTDFNEVERVLVDKLGGMVKTIDSTIPATPETFSNLLLKIERQDEEMQALKKMVMDLTKITKELPQPADHTSEIAEIKNGMMTKEQAEALISRLSQQEREKQEIENEMKLLKDKLDIAVDYIQAQETEKKGFWKRLFG